MQASTDHYQLIAQQLSNSIIISALIIGSSIIIAILLKIYFDVKKASAIEDARFSENIEEIKKIANSSS